MATWAEVQVEVGKKLSGELDGEEKVRAEEVLKRAEMLWPEDTQKEFREGVEQNISRWKELRKERKQIEAQQMERQNVLTNLMQTTSVLFAKTLGFEPGKWVELSLSEELAGYYEKSGLYKIVNVYPGPEIHWSYYTSDEVTVQKGTYIDVPGESKRFPGFRLEMAAFNEATGKPISRRERGHRRNPRGQESIKYQVTSLPRLAALRVMTEEEATERMSRNKKATMEKAKAAAKAVKELTMGMSQEEVAKLVEAAEKIRKGEK